MGFMISLVAVLWFIGLSGQRSLFHPDEGRYAEIPREMFASGDWITPRLNGVKYFEKPPLQYWATAASYVVFGDNASASRVWVGLTGFGCTIVVAVFGTMLFGAATGLIAAAVLASSFLFFVAGHVNTLDMGLTFWLTCALCCFMAVQLTTRASASTALHSAMWICLGFAVLSKGLVALVLPAVSITIYCMLSRDLSFIRRINWTVGIALLLLVTLPWFLMVSYRNPEFAHFFFVHEHFERYLTTTHGRSQPWWIYLPVLLVGLMPWIGVFPAAIWRSLSQPREAAQFNGDRFLGVWVVTVVVFFSASGSKLPFYVLPAIPAAALLIARRLAQAQPAAIARDLAPAALGGVVLIACAIAAHFWPLPGSLKALAVDWADSLAIGGVLLIAGYFAARRMLLAGTQPLAAVTTLAVMAYLGFFAILVDAEDLAPHYSGALMAEEINRRVRHDTVVYSIGVYDQTIPFYIKKPVQVVGFRGELDFGMRQEPLGWPADERAFEQIWAEGKHALALMSVASFERLRHQGLPMQVLYRADRHLLVETVPPGTREAR